MRIIIRTIIALLIFAFAHIGELKAQGQDPITEYDGIPLIIYPAKRVGEMTYPLNFIQMDNMGVYAVVAGDILDNSSYIEYFTDNNLKAIPQYVWGETSNLQDVIWKYTNSHYTVWEAEGTYPTGGNATLYFDEEHTSYFSKGNIEGRRAGGYDVPDGQELIFGPGYPQNATYNFSSEPVFYTIEYRMKIEQRDPDLPQEFLNDVVCTLMVTNRPDGGGSEEIVVSKEVRVSEFGGWDNWATIDTSYDLSQYITTDQFWGSRGPALIPRGSAYFVQFKVIWAGLDYVNLYIDKIRVYDQKGLDLMEIPAPRNLITTLVNEYISDPTIIGWYGTDEPGSIDNYEPFRIVDNIISSVSQQNNFPIRLHAAITGSWQGKFAFSGSNYGMAHDLYVSDEFWLRAKPKNIQMNMYIYHNPWSPWDVDYNPNWKEDNIDKYLIEWGLDKINNYDSSFAVSTQSGAYYFIDSLCNVVDSFVIPTPSQINYHVNLSLMYGAKEIRLDPFFSKYHQPPCDNVLSTFGLIIENDEETENYYFFKNTLIPRLNGWFGKTLRKIRQTEQHPNINPSVASFLNLNCIKKIRLAYQQNPEALPSWIDLGFFDRQSEPETNYFMIVNRYYSDEWLNEFIIDFQNLTGFANWNLRNYIDSSEVTLLPDANGYVSSPTYVINNGDGILFGASPVVLYGGTLIANETAGEGMTLYDDMVIKNSATLTIAGNYIAKGNIIIENGSIENLDGGRIIFQDGKKLIVNGIATISGTSEEKLTLDFTSSNSENGIVIEQGTLHLSYCEIKNASNGVIAQPGSGQISIQHSEFINCSSAGIILLGSSTEGPQSPPHNSL